jgi:hypothetical protein
MDIPKDVLFGSGERQGFERTCGEESRGQKDHVGIVISAVIVISTSG